MLKNPVIVITGPTACGKSKLAIDLALKINGVIINCDSMQIYKGIPIISAAPSAEDRALVEHRLFEIYDCDKRGNVVEWLDACAWEVRSLWQENRIPIVVGGTGMYVDALIEGITPIPPTPPEVRQKVKEMYKEKGLPEVYEYLKNIDAYSAQKLAPNDKSRVLRAVEIYLATGRRMSDWHKVPLIKKLPEADFFVVQINPNVQEIEARCRERLDKMVNEQGVLKEIADLLALNLSNDMPVMKALGVQDLGEFIKGTKPLKEALKLAKMHTRQYVKRQRTWLKGKLHPDLKFEFIYSGQEEFVRRILNMSGL